MKISDETTEERLKHYLSISSQFHLGKLPTEQSHPDTHDLSHLAKNDLESALRVSKSVDRKAVDVLLEEIEGLKLLTERIRETFESGKRVYLVGCGATGRLSIALETIWRQLKSGTAEIDSVRSFMAGGDVALIKSIESFEDVPEFAKRQLVESEFQDGDLLIGCSEGGETPFVIGAVEEASILSSNPPFFLYCNPDSILSLVAERSRKIIGNPNVEKISLETGPMAVSGSTRMQATTVLMAAVGYCLLNANEPFEAILEKIRRFISAWEKLDTSFLVPFIEKESECYLRNEYLLYETNEIYGISILTDTTERAPTFSLLPFENRNSPQNLSWCYLFFPHVRESESAWNLLLQRPPRTLEWSEINGIASRSRLLGFDFSQGLLENRMRLGRDLVHHYFKIYQVPEGISLALDNLEFKLPTKDLDRLTEHLLLKLVLNTHSTLIMGRLGRYEGNVMTWVRASNFKLIDRAIRYIDRILQKENIHLTYEEIAKRCFQKMAVLREDQPLVLEVVGDVLANSDT